MGWCTKVRKSLVKGIAFEFLSNSSEPIRSNQYNGSCNILCNVFEPFMAAACEFFCQSNVGFSEVR